MLMSDRQKDGNSSVDDLANVYKSWYILGINKEINSLKSLVERLRELTADCKEIITVGNSAGGYAACYVGILLSAKRIYNFCGQFSLNDEIKQNTILTKHISNEFVDISVLANSSEINMIYFYSGKCKADIKQMDLLEKRKEIISLKFNSKIHGRTVYSINMPKLLAMNDDEILLLYEHYKGKMISPFVFSLRISGIKDTATYLAHMMKKKICKG